MNQSSAFSPILSKFQAFLNTLYLIFKKNYLQFSLISVFLSYCYLNRPNYNPPFKLIKNKGLISLIKQREKIIRLMQKKLNKSQIDVHDQMYFFPSGLTNSGNNCYINVIFQVNCVNIKRQVHCFFK